MPVFYPPFPHGSTGAIVPLRLKDAAQAKLEATIADVQAAPGKLKEAAQAKVEATIAEVQAAPDKLKDAAQAKVHWAANTRFEIEQVSQILQANY